MRSPVDMDIVQIDISTKCHLKCSNCTRLIPHQPTRDDMKLDVFEHAVKSMEGWQAPGRVIGVIAGEPTLHSEFEQLSRRFADKHEDRFDGVGYHLGPEGRIRLDGALAHIECERFATYPGGDHTIVIGRVIGGETHDGHPLLYYRGGYAALG